MPFVHAYKRTKTYTHTFPDVTLTFEPNAQGDVVCDVQDEFAVDRLMQVPTGFRLYESESKPEPLAEVIAQVVPHSAPAKRTGKAGKHAAQVVTLPPAEPVSPFVLKNGDEEFDLRPLDDAALVEFAQANGIALEDGITGDAIRTAIVDALSIGA